MKKLILIHFLISILNISYAQPSVDVCHPLINKAQANYLVGYGSLMNEESRSRTNPHVKVLVPVKVEGFVREWSAITPGYKIIYLGAAPCNIHDKKCFLNGLAYLVTDVKEADEREGIYCRQEIKRENLHPYRKKDNIDSRAKYWIYVTKPEASYHPDKTHPLIQSYVDLFISGCIEQAASINNKTINALVFPDDYNFVFDCINGTKGWTTNFWLNDRIYPERPWAGSPNALKIDQVLAKSYNDKVITGKYHYMNIPLE